MKARGSDTHSSLLLNDAIHIRDTVSVVSHLSLPHTSHRMAEHDKKIKCAVVGAGPVGALAALYAARRGYEVEVYELRGGEYMR